MERANKTTSKDGFIITYILIFGFTFLILLSSLLSFILFQLKQAKYELAMEQALYVAEAGLNRYRWYIVHKSQELFNGEEIGCPPSDCHDCSPCEYEHILPGFGVIGKYQLEVVENRPCEITTGVSVVATGWTTEFPNFQRTIRVHYIRPTVAEYSYILNHNVWAGADRIIMGPYHSNGGIRMDGSNNSLVTSEQTEWICTSSYGCASCPDECEHIGGQGCICPGVFTTANGEEEFFRVGASHFDFEGITVDLGQIKGLSQPPPEGEGKGLYFPPSGEEGYHVILKGREVEVRKITELSRVRAYTEEQDYHWEYSIISGEEAGIDYFLSGCGLIYIEDNVWVEGEIEGKITLAVADLISPGKEADTWLKDDIVYQDGNSADGFVLIGQHNTLIAPDSPDYMELNGVYVAQTGNFGMNHYTPWRYGVSAKKEELKIFGSIVSNGRVGTKWTSTGGVWVSGYRERINIYDPELSFDPPSFLPYISEEFRYKGWEEIQ